jgi:CBS domain-containing protein
VGKATTVRNPLIRAPQATNLSAPVGSVMRPTLTVETVDSLARGASLFRENGASILPVVDGEGRLVGVLSDASLARALAETSEPTDAVGPYAEPAETLEPYATAAEALRRGEDGRTRVVVDDSGRVVGLVSAVDLWPRRRVPPKPSTVGGMATPFGVYLTTGNVSAGAPWWALMTTGAAMLGMLIVGTMIAKAAVDAGLPAAAELPITYLCFLGLLRLSPLSGTHGAEHQVVHAIEREESLTPDVVRRMPRVHPRCGTNVATGISILLAGLFLGVGSNIQSNELASKALSTIEDQISFRALPALIVAVIFARPLGGILQQFIMTKPASDAQMNGAIRAGEELLTRHATARMAAANPFQRIWNMGFLQVIAGAFLAASVIAGIKWATGFTWLPEVM